MTIEVDDVASMLVGSGERKNYIIYTRSSCAAVLSFIYLELEKITITD